MIAAASILLVSSCVQMGYADVATIAKADAAVQVAAAEAASSKGWSLVVQKGVGGERRICEGSAMALAEKEGATFALTPVLNGAPTARRARAQKGDTSGLLRIWYAGNHRMVASAALGTGLARALEKLLPTPDAFALERRRELAKSRVVVQIPDWPLPTDALHAIAQHIADALPAGKARLTAVAIVPLSKQTPEELAAPYHADYVVRGWPSEGTKGELHLQLYDVALHNGLGAYESLTLGSGEETARAAGEAMKRYAASYLDDR